MKNNCKFCKISKNEEKSYTVFENKTVKAFLDVNPVSEGHTLIIPKKHYENIHDIPEKILEKLITVSKKLSLDYSKKLNASGFNILHASGKDANQSVFHFHIHLVPRYANDGLDMFLKMNNDSKTKLKETFEKIRK